MTKWARGPQSRQQMVLYSERLDEALPAHHMVRLLDEILGGGVGCGVEESSDRPFAAGRCIDWSQWEAAYHGRLGQPAIHPRVLASVLLYGLLTRIRSSRGLEEALEVRMDFRWLAEGRTIDHTTLSEFRRKHAAALKDLFVQIVQIARGMGVAALARLGFDGTRVRASNRRSGTRTPDELRRERDELSAKFDEYAHQADQEDARDEELFDTGSAHELPPELRDGQRRLAKLNEVLDDLDRLREAGGTVPKRLPVTDLEARVMPNKDGGHAPNYTPTATVDIESGLIVEADVLNVVNEDGALVPALDEARRDYGLASPLEVLTDGLNGTGANLAACAERDISIISPCDVPDPVTNPALRADPTQAVPEADWDRLPTQRVRVEGQPGTQLDKSAFVYDAERDCYWCPLGTPLPYANTTTEKSGSGQRIRRRYQASAEACAGCPLRARCLQRKAKARQINREQYEAHRERHARKMATPEAQATYALRRHPGERPFAMIKHHFGLRRFLLRGLDRVRNEWRWAAIAFNLHRLMSIIRSRAGPTVGLSHPP